MRSLKYAATLFASLVVLFCAFIFWATRPVVSDSQWPAQKIISYFEPSSPVVTPKQLTLVTYNMGYASGQKNNQEVLTQREAEQNLEDIIRVLKEADADIIALQEVDFPSARTFKTNQMEAIAKALNMPYAAHVTTWNLKYLPFPYWPPRRHFGAILSGQCILSRYPLIEQSFHVFPKPKENSFWYNWFYLDRVLQEVTVQLGDRLAKVWNVHLEAYQEATRLKQAEFVGERVREDLTPLKFVLGDFNSKSFSINDPQYQHDAEALKLFQSESGLTNAETETAFYTIPSWEPKDKIDHIFYSASVTMQSVQSLVSLGSDHLPVKAVFVLE
jgi:endonuclease/exonuclease/phosphatase family metal-dependent hydrolase